MPSVIVNDNLNIAHCPGWICMNIFRQCLEQGKEKRRQEASFDLWHGHGAKMKTSKPKKQQKRTTMNNRAMNDVK